MKTIYREQFTDINVIDDIHANGIKMIGVDIENVLTDYHNPEIFPSAAKQIGEIATHGVKIALITNNRDQGFLDEVESQLPQVDEIISPALGFDKKPSPQMLQYATLRHKVEPEEAAFVDDQLKNYFAAKRADYSRFFLTMPAGDHQHPGVRMARFLEAIPRSILMTKQIGSLMLELGKGDH